MPDIFERTIRSPSAFDLQPQGRSTNLNKIYLGFVKDVNDVHRQGRIKVWIPEICGDKTKPDSWMMMQYASPFAGATNIFDVTNGDAWTDSQTSYGMWFVPPDVENEVICAFINGDPGRGIWFGCLYNQYMNHMVPGIPGDSDDTPGLPVAEYNKLTEKDAPFHVKRPIYSPLANQLTLQGLQNDPTRGISNSGAQRNSPANQVYGTLTPGGSQIVYDDNPENAFIRIRTKHGAQVVINDTVGSVYINSRDGANWIELGGDGFVDIYSTNDISIRTQGDMNFRADGNMYFDAGNSIFMKARGQKRQFDPLIFLDPTDAGSEIVGQKHYSYSGNYQVGSEILSTNSTIPPVIPNPRILSSANSATNTNNYTTSNVTAGSMTATNTVSIGDSIAFGTANSFGCKSLATVGIGIAAINKVVASNSPITSPYVILSAGANDDYTRINTIAPYQQLRSAIPSTTKVIWILPANNRVAAAFEKTLAQQYNDYTVDLLNNPSIPLSSDSVHPKNYKNLVDAILNIPANLTTAQPPAAADTNTAAPGAVNGTINLANGQYIQFKKDSTPKTYNGPIFLVEGVGTSIHLVPVGNGASGEIRMESAGDMHTIAHGDMYSTTIKDNHRLAGGDVYDTAVGSFNRLAGDSIADQAAGDTYSIRAGADVVISGAHVHANGPLAPNADQASQAQSQPDNLLADVSFDAVSQKYVNIPTIVGRLPTHEPFIEHNQAGNATGFAVDGRGAPHAAAPRKNLPPLAVITGPHLAWGSKVNSYANGGNEFRGKVFSMAEKLGLPPASTVAPTWSGADWLMAIMNFESAGSFSPSKRCAVSSATGLIQFMNSTATSLGTTTDRLAALAPEKQLDYVYQYFSSHVGSYKNLGDLYMAVIYPLGIGKSDSFVLFSQGTSAYSSNHGLDNPYKGSVTRGDCLKRVSASLDEGLRVGNIWQAK